MKRILLATMILAAAGCASNPADISKAQSRKTASANSEDSIAGSWAGYASFEGTLFKCPLPLVCSKLKAEISNTHEACRGTYRNAAGEILSVRVECEDSYLSGSGKELFAKKATLCESQVPRQDGSSFLALNPIPEGTAPISIKHDSKLDMLWIHNSGESSLKAYFARP